MRPMTFASGLLALLLGAAPALAQQQAGVLSAEQLFERVAPSVWMVETFDAQNRPLAAGSGVVVAPGRVITNCHVLARAKRVVVSRENVSYGASLEYPDPERDLCQLKVANFTAPPVPVAGVEGIKIGSRVYAVGNPRGFEQTISDGLLSGIRRSESGDFTALQITVPISKGSSGGGLFDTRGQLIGITTFMIRDAQNVNFALPASWIGELPERAQAALQKSKDGETRAVARAATSPSSRVYEYQLRDRISGVTKPVVYRLDRTDGDKLVFNQGSRIERSGGEVVKLAAGIAGEFENAMPPGGWIAKEPAAGAFWRIKYVAHVAGRIGMELEARAAGESTMRFKDGELRILRVDFTGYTERGSVSTNPRGTYKAVAWYAPELGRVVRFEARSRGGVGGGAFVIDEVLELVDVRSE